MTRFRLISALIVSILAAVLLERVFEVPGVGVIVVGICVAGVKRYTEMVTMIATMVVVFAATLIGLEVHQHAGSVAGNVIGGALALHGALLLRRLERSQSDPVEMPDD